MNNVDLILIFIIIVLFTLWQNRRKEANFWRDAYILKDRDDR